MNVNTTIMRGDRGTVTLITSRDGTQVAIAGLGERHVPAYMAEHAKKRIAAGDPAYSVWQDIHTALNTGDINGSLR